MARKMYDGPLASVSFDGELCQHSGNCVGGMPSVFNTKKKPWIDPTTLTNDDERDLLAEVVGRCPSGALKFHPTVS
jgi:uncharacterized Fe-S cluster protein YjdI